MFFENKMLSRRIAVLLAALACGAVLCGCGNEQPEPAATQVAETVQTTAATEEAAQLQELVVEAVEEQEDFVVVTTSYCQVKYPFAFGDLIQVRAVNESGAASLEFIALIAREEHPLFALHFGGREGIPLGILEVPGEAAARAVHAEFYSANEKALGDRVNTYLAAQESFNDVVASLQENPGFSQAE